MSNDVEVFTTDGEKIEVGSVVFVEDGKDAIRGKVLFITDPDGDVNEAELPIAISPKIEVEFSLGYKETFDTINAWSGREEPSYEAEELYSDRTLIES